MENKKIMAIHFNDGEILNIDADDAEQGIEGFLNLIKRNEPIPKVMGIVQYSTVKYIIVKNKEE